LFPGFDVIFLFALHTKCSGSMVAHILKLDAFRRVRYQAAGDDDKQESGDEETLLGFRSGRFRRFVDDIDTRAIEAAARWSQ
jgi:hypothetical protein